MSYLYTYTSYPFTHVPDSPPNRHPPSQANEIRKFVIHSFPSFLLLIASNLARLSAREYALGIARNTMASNGVLEHGIQGYR